MLEADRSDATGDPGDDGAEERGEGQAENPGDDGAEERGEGQAEERSHERSYWQSIHRQRREILSVREEMTRDRGPIGAAIDRIGNLLANPVFFAALLAIHLVWMILNSGLLPLRPWDPYPFMLLATVASAEAPFVALLILMRQQRDRRIEELREEVDLQVALHAERETTRILRLAHEIARAVGMSVEEDEELERMTGGLEPRKLFEEVRERIEEVDEAPGEADE